MSVPSVEGPRRPSPLPVIVSPSGPSAEEEGFLNRWNSLATTLEDEPREIGERHLVAAGWSAGKHAAAG